jgi:oxalate decarboxylase/phosphoglucose isomerase-like protein (cupin superfamily)
MFGIFNFKKKNKSVFIKSSEPFILKKDIIYDEKKYYSLKDIKEELLDYTDNKNSAFCIYNNITRDRDSSSFKAHNLKNTLFLIKGLKIGREYNKTSSIIVKENDSPLLSIMEIISGEGYILLENLKKNIIKIIEVRERSLVIIPRNYSFTIINKNENRNLIGNLLSKNDSKLNLKHLLINGGNSLFYTDTGFIKNKNADPYVKIEEYENNYLEDYNYDKNEKGIYESFLNFPEKFNIFLE